MQPDPGTIVVVEDNESDADVARRAIEQWGGPGTRVVVAEDGLRAAELLLPSRNLPADATPAPALILIDINLPGLDGVELLSRIRRHPPLRHVPVVMVSSSAEEEDVLRSYERGCNGYVTKPVDCRTLRSLYASLANYWIRTNTSPRARLA